MSVIMLLIFSQVKYINIKDNLCSKETSFVY